MDWDDLHKERACYWAPLPVGRDGKATYARAIEIMCRWEDGQTEFSMPKAKEGVWTSESSVFTAHPVVKGGYLWYGRLYSATDLDVPHNNPDARRIEMRERTPSVDDPADVEYVAYI